MKNFNSSKWITEQKHGTPIDNYIISLITETFIERNLPKGILLENISNSYKLKIKNRLKELYIKNPELLNEGIWDTIKYKLVGTDASGLELRCLAHYLNDNNYTDEILNGDIHTKNMELAGIKNRDQAKTFIYAFLYGAGPDKIGKIVGAGKEQGKMLIKRFLSNLPALRRLREQVENAGRRGKIKAIDGRYLKVRNAHSALNTLLQGAGAIICKHWLLRITHRVYNKKLDVKLVASVHDEYQFEVANKDVGEFCSITKIAIKETENLLKLRCPLDNDYKVGVTWAETH